jgi:hypothetical protein
LRAGWRAQVNSPAGPSTRTGAPGCRLSCSQFDTLPPGTRLTVIEIVWPRGRRRDRVARLIVSPSMSSSSVMNCPGSNENVRPCGERKKLFTSCVSCRTWQHTSVSSTSLVQRSGSAFQNAGA